MRIALPSDNWWRTACETAGDEAVLLPPTCPNAPNPYTADVAARSAIGPRWLDQLRQRHFDMILDNGGGGLAFVPDPGGTSTAKLLHEIAGVPLVSHWIDPLVTVFQALPPEIVWACLDSGSWFKFVWDKRQCDELRRFGVDNVHHLPMAAPDREYDTNPLDPAAVTQAVSFVGGQNTSCFFPGRTVSPQRLLAGTLADGVRRDRPGTSFLETYYDMFELAEPPRPNDDASTRAGKATEYFADKLYYNAAQCIKQRDRFVIFLKKKLGDSFALVGNRWDQAYGLSCRPALPTTEAYLQHFRTTAVNLNLVNGNSDCGLNMRHFEITAAGGFMLCNHQAELADCFDIGSECDTFRNEQELLAKVQHYLERPKERMAIARAGQQRTLRDHLYSHRLESIRRVLTPAAPRTNSPQAAPLPS